MTGAIRITMIQRLEAVAACLGVGIAAALPFAGHAGLVSRFDIGFVPEGCELNDFACSTASTAFWIPTIAIVLAGALFGTVAASLAGARRGRTILAAGLGGLAFVAGALVTQATVGDNPVALGLNQVFGTATLDQMPVWLDVARQFGLSVFAVAGSFTLLLGLLLRPRRAPVAAVMAGLTGALAFGVTTWFLDQVAGVTIAPREPPSAMPTVALTSNFVAGVAAAAVAMAALTVDRRALRRGPSQSPSTGASQVAS